MLLNLYPRAWRERYEDEFIALLEARPPDARDRVDIIRGAIDARLHPAADTGGSFEPPPPVPYDGPWNIHRAGQITLAGGLLYLATLLIAINGPLVSSGGEIYRDGSAAFLTLFLSVVMLLLGSWAVASTLPDTSQLGRAAAGIGAIAGLLWAVAPWMFYFGAALALGLTILAIEAARTRRWRWSDSMVLIGGIVAAVGFAAVALAGLPGWSGSLPIFERDVQFVAMFLLSPVWFATAHALLRPAIAVADPVAGGSSAA